MKPITRLTYLSFCFNSLLDQDFKISPLEIKKHIEDKSIFEWLKIEFNDKIDLSLYEAEDKRVLLELFNDLALAVNEKRKFDVENNGLSLLLAYCIEGIQRLDVPKL